MPTTTTRGETPLLIALGSNQRHPAHGPPGAVLLAAVAALATAGFRVLAVSRLWSTAPVGPPQPVYANACLAVAPPVALASPEAVLAALKGIERAFGRKARRRWGPRVLDLDIIGWGGLIWLRRGAGHGLIVPHPRAHGRAFVLLPLCDVAPLWRHPVRLRTARQLAARLPRRGVRPVAWPCVITPAG